MITPGVSGSGALSVTYPAAPVKSKAVSSYASVPPRGVTAA